MKLGKWFFVLCAVFIVAACGSETSDGDKGTGGSGGGSGAGTTGPVSTSAATVDESNKTGVARTAKVGSEKAIEGSTAPRGINKPSLSYALMKDTVSMLDGGLLGRNTVDMSSSVCPGGGSASYQTTDQNSEYGTFTIVYDNCVYTYGSESTTVDGTATWTFNEDNSFSYKYNITTTYAGETTTITGTYSCDAEYNCSYQDNFADGGTNYSISNVSVTGNNSSGFGVSARVAHETYGYVEVQGTGLILCSGGGFSAGSISVTDSSGSTVLQVDFVSCTEMTVTFNGVAETVSQ